MKRKTTLIVMLCTLMLLNLPDTVHGAAKLPPDLDMTATLSTADAPTPQGDILISQEDAFEIAPAVAYNTKHNEYLVVWQKENSSLKFGIYAQRVSADGTLITPTPIQIADDVSFSQIQAAVAYDATYDRYLIVWCKEVGVLTGDIYGRFLTWNGSLPQVAFKIAENGSNSHSSPKVAYGETAGDYMVTWTTKTATGTGIAAQVIPGNGGTVNPGSWISVAYTAGAEVRKDPDIAYNGTHNEFDVVYQKYDTVRSDNDIFATRLQPDGSRVADCDGFGPDINSECAIWAFTAEETMPAIAHCDEEDRTLILWQNDDGSGENIIGQMSTGANMGYYNYVSLAGNSNVDEIYPQVACSDAGAEFMAVWQEWDASVGKSIYGRAIALNGGTSDVVAVQAPASTYSYANVSAAIVGGHNNFFVSWEQERLGIGWGDIYARMFLLESYVVYMPISVKSP